MSEFVQIVVRAFILTLDWCLAEETSGAKRRFLVDATKVKYPRIVTGGKIDFCSYPQSRQRVEPTAQDDLLVLRFSPHSQGEQYSCVAELVVFKEDYEKVIDSQKKASEKLAKLAAEEAERQRRRAEDIIRCRRMKGQGKGGKKKQKANA